MRYFERCRNSSNRKRMLFNKNLKHYHNFIELQQQIHNIGVIYSSGSFFTCFIGFFLLSIYSKHPVFVTDEEFWRNSKKFACLFSHAKTVASEIHIQMRWGEKGKIHFCFCLPAEWISFSLRCEVCGEIIIHQKAAGCFMEWRNLWTSRERKYSCFSAQLGRWKTHINQLELSAPRFRSLLTNLRPWSLLTMELTGGTLETTWTSLISWQSSPSFSNF